MSKASLIRTGLVLASVLGAPQAIAEERHRYNGEAEAYDFGIETEGEVAMLYLSRKPTNEPLTGLVPVLNPDEASVPKLTFKETATPGVYMTLVAGGKLPEGQLAVTVDGKEEAVDVYAAEAAHGHGEGEHGHDHSHGGAKKVELGKMFKGLGGSGVMLGFAGLGLFLLGLVVGRVVRSGREAVHAPESKKEEGGHDYTKMGAALFAGMLALGFGASKARAEEGHSHSDVGVSAAGDTSEILVTKKAQFLIDMRTLPAKKQQVHETLKTFGHVIAKPQHDAVVRAVGPGFVKGTLTKALGAKVKKGEVLAQIQGLTRIEVTSPVTGTIVDVMAVEGVRVDAGAELFRVVDTSVVWVDAEVFQKDLPIVRGAQKAFVDFDGETATVVGKISGARSVVDEKTLTTKLFVEIDNAGDKIALGSLANVTIELEKAYGEGIVLPKSAVLNRGGERIVFVQVGVESFVAKPVATSFGPRPNEIVVTNGLAEGDRVVVSGNYQLLVGAH